MGEATGSLSLFPVWPHGTNLPFLVFITNLALCIGVRRTGDRTRFAGATAATLGPVTHVHQSSSGFISFSK